MVTTEKAKVIVTKDDKFATRWLSPYRVKISKPVGEKYARKLIQDFLHTRGLYNTEVWKLHKHENGIDSEETGVYGLCPSGMQVFLGSFRVLDSEL